MTRLLQLLLNFTRPLLCILQMLKTGGTSVELRLPVVNMQYCSREGASFALKRLYGQILHV